ncbi:MAG: hypothetical protein AAGN82_31050 [Myxococcota bacterium]
MTSLLPRLKRLTSLLAALLTWAATQTVAVSAAADEAPPAADEAPGSEKEAPATSLDDLTVDELIAKGRAFTGEKNWSEALRHLQRAYDRGATDQIGVVGNLGIVEQELGMYVSSAGHLRVAFGLLPPDAPPIQREALQVRLAEVEARVVKLDLVVTPADACVRLASDPSPDDPGCRDLKRPVYTEPGTVVIVGTADGYAEQKLERVVAAGENLGVTLTLVPEDAAPEPGGGGGDGDAGASTVEEDDDTLMPLWPGLVVMGVGVAGVVTGGVLFAQSGGPDTDAEDALMQLRADTGQEAPCVSPSPGPVADRCASIADDLSSHDTLSNAGLGALVAGGALVVGGAVLLGLSFVEGDGADEGGADEARNRRPWVRDVRVAPWVQPDAQGGWASGGVAIGGAW